MKQRHTSGTFFSPPAVGGSRFTPFTQKKNQKKRKNKDTNLNRKWEIEALKMHSKAFRLSLDMTFVGKLYLLVFCRHCSASIHYSNSSCPAPVVARVWSNITHITKQPFGQENYLYTQRKQASKTISSWESDMKAVVTGQKERLIDKTRGSADNPARINGW